MNWSDEHYIKCYTRDSLTWKTWRWETRTLLLHLLRKVDAAGFIETGKLEPAAALTIQLELPREVVDAGLAELVSSGTAELTDRAVLVVNFVEAQEARKSDPQKKRDQRDRIIAKRRAVQTPDTTTPHVTGSHPVSPVVTQTYPPDLPRSVSPDLPRSATAEAATPKEHLAVVVIEPTTPADVWAGEDFWRWFQAKRQRAGFVAEKPPHPAKLSAWFSAALQTLNGDIEVLKDAVLTFGDDKFWQGKDPPLPFAGFSSQCPPKWIRRRKERPRAEG